MKTYTENRDGKRCPIPRLKKDIPLYSENFIIELLKFSTGDERTEVHSKVLEVFKQTLNDNILEAMVDPVVLRPGETAGDLVKIIKETWV
jgi:hypothetical protein